MYFHKKKVLIVEHDKQHSKLSLRQSIPNIAAGMVCLRVVSAQDILQFQHVFAKL